MQEERRSALSATWSAQLFAGRGRSLPRFTSHVPFTVIGELAKKDQNNSYNGLDG